MHVTCTVLKEGELWKLAIDRRCERVCGRITDSGTGYEEGKQVWSYRASACTACIFAGANMCTDAKIRSLGRASIAVF